jgi:hypothetical protein
MMKKLSVSIIFLYTTFFLFSLDFEAVKALDESEFPLTHNIVLRNGDEFELALLPEIPGAEKIRQTFHNIPSAISVEKLYKIPLGADFSGSVRDVFLKLANIFGNPETQTKYLYRSARAKKIVPLIGQAYICNVYGRKIDPLTFSFLDIPGTFDYYQYVDEFSFTPIVMKISLSITEQQLYVSITNAESLKYGIFPLIPKESMYTNNFMFIDNNILYVYSVTQLVRDINIEKIGPYTIRPAGMTGKRMDIIANWIKGELLLALAQ